MPNQISFVFWTRRQKLLGMLYRYGYVTMATKHHEETNKSPAKENVYRLQPLH